MSYTIPNIILWAKAAQPLARLGEVNKKRSIGGAQEKNLDMQLYNARLDLSYSYAQEPASNTTFTIGQYVLSLMGVWIFAAQSATGGGGGGGSVTPVTPIVSGGYYVLPLGVTSPPSTGQPVAGQSTYQNDLMIGATQLQYIIYNNVVMTILEADFTVDTATGILTLQNGNVFQVGDRILIPFVLA